MTGGGGLDAEGAARRVEDLRRAFGIDGEPLIGESYCDLAMAAAAA